MTPNEQQEMVRWTEEYEDNIRMACGRLGCDIEVEGYLSAAVCDRADKVFHNYGIHKL